MKHQVKVAIISILVLLSGYLLYLFLAYNALSKNFGRFDDDLQFVASVAPALCIAMDKATELEQLRPRITALSNDLQRIDDKQGPLVRLEIACAVFCRHSPNMETPLQKIIPMLDSIEAIFQNSVANNEVSRTVKEEWTGRISDISNTTHSVATAGGYCKNGSNFFLAAKMVMISMNLAKVKQHIVLLDYLSNGGIYQYPYFKYLMSRLEETRQQVKLIEQSYPLVPSKLVRWMAFYRFSKTVKKYPICPKLKEWAENALKNHQTYPIAK